MKSTKNEQPLVSVIMPTYNQADFISLAIDSVLNQTIQDFELIIIDNFSNDGTEKVISSYNDERIRYLKFHNNGIIASSRNVGIKRSKGEYIAFIDSDDHWNKDKLEKQLPHFKNKEIVAVSSRTFLFGEKVFFRKSHFKASEKGFDDYSYRDILNSNQVVTSSLIAKRTHILQAGLFNENLEYSCIEDWDLWLRLVRYGMIRILDEKLFSYYVARKRGEAYCAIAENMLKVIAEQKQLGYLNESEYVEPPNAVYLTIARSYLLYNASKSRTYYKKVIANTLQPRRIIKSLIGIIISIFPNSIKHNILYLLYKAEKLILI